MILYSFPLHFAVGSTAYIYVLRGLCKHSRITHWSNKGFCIDTFIKTQSNSLNNCLLNGLLTGLAVGLVVRTVFGVVELVFLGLASAVPCRKPQIRNRIPKKKMTRQNLRLMKFSVESFHEQKFRGHAEGKRELVFALKKKLSGGFLKRFKINVYMYFEPR